MFDFILEKKEIDQEVRFTLEKNGHVFVQLFYRCPKNWRPYNSGSSQSIEMARDTWNEFVRRGWERIV